MKSLSIISEDHTGLLAEVTALLEKKGFEVADFAAQVIGNTAVINLTVEPCEEAFRLLSDAGYRVVAQEHLLLRLEKHAGALARLSRRLADAEVEVRGMHIVNADEKAAIVALETASPAAAREILKELLIWEN
jgi:hypothetical protein